MTEGTIDPFNAEAPPELAAVRTGEDLEWPLIEDYLRKNLPKELDLAGTFEVLQFPNGAANLTYMVRFGNTELVLRRPPFGTLAPGAHDMKREYRVLSKLWQAFDAAPRAYLFCDDRKIANADFFVMERRRGEVIRGVIPKNMRQFDNVGYRIGMALVKAIGDFHLLDPESVELGNLGRPDGFVERQVNGWKQRWDLVVDDRYDEVMTQIYAELVNKLPVSQRVSFVHNDLKLDNCMFDASNPDEVTAFFDWDMTTLGDPLIDFGTLLNYWPDPMDTEEVKRSSHDGMTRMNLPSRAEIIDSYAEHTGFDVSNIRWYEAFAQWKTATVIQQLHHRWKVGDSTDERMKTIGDSLPRLASSAVKLLESS